MTMQKTTKSTISEIKEITGNAVAKKQDAAKLNFPKILEKIRNAAKNGESHIYLSNYEYNTYDKELLEKEGFSVWYTTIPQPKWQKDWFKQQYMEDEQKGWKVSW